jgi:23S rRNA pseudouridine1911/1915/1917 synthase
MKLDIKKVKVLYEDNHLIAVNKPAGWLVHGDETKDTPLTDYVKAWIKVKHDKPGDVFLGVIHRLDRPVSGVVVFAKTSKGLARMNELFKKRAIKKVYWAITNKAPRELTGSLHHFIKKDPKRNTSNVIDKMGKNNKTYKEAKLNYSVIGRLAGHFLLEIDLLTGRSHQIRAQLGHIGCPVKGDLKYGFTVANSDATIHLHSRSLSFIHPVKKVPIEIVAPVPKDQVWELF